MMARFVDREGEDVDVVVDCVVEPVGEVVCAGGSDHV
jgi:hypothetical protein